MYNERYETLQQTTKEIKTLNRGQISQRFIFHESPWNFPAILLTKTKTKDVEADER